jgi:hypothetical protein
MTFADSADLEPDPIEIDPRPCELCGCTIDWHERVDAPEGPDFFCDDFERQVYLAACALVLSWEMDDPRDAWRHTGEPRPEVPEYPVPARPPYRTPQATIDAFRYLVRLGDQQRLANWLKNHPADAPAFLKLLEQAA